MTYIPSASYANTASVATSISFIPATSSFATTSSYGVVAKSASYAVSASYAPGGGGAFLPLAGNPGNAMTGPISMSFGSDTGLEKFVINASATSNARIGANVDTGIVFSINAFYIGGGNWVKDDVSIPSFTTFQHLTNR